MAGGILNQSIRKPETNPIAKSLKTVRKKDSGLTHADVRLKSGKTHFLELALKSRYMWKVYTSARWRRLTGMHQLHLLSPDTDALALISADTKIDPVCYQHLFHNLYFLK